jgi:hypothetical protein
MTDIMGWVPPGESARQKFPQTQSHKWFPAGVKPSQCGLGGGSALSNAQEILASSEHLPKRHPDLSNTRLLKPFVPPITASIRESRLLPVRDMTLPVEFPYL